MREKINYWLDRPLGNIGWTIIVILFCLVYLGIFAGYFFLIWAGLTGKISWSW